MSPKRPPGVVKITTLLRRHEEATAALAFIGCTHPDSHREIKEAFAESRERLLLSISHLYAAFKEQKRPGRPTNQVTPNQEEQYDEPDKEFLSRSPTYRHYGAVIDYSKMFR